MSSTGFIFYSVVVVVVIVVLVVVLVDDLFRQRRFVPHVMHSRVVDYTDTRTGHFSMVKRFRVVACKGSACDFFGGIP